MWVCKVSLPRKGREGERWKEKRKKGKKRRDCGG